MKCEDFVDVLAASLDEADEDALVGLRVRRHIEECAACREEAAALREVLVTLRADAARSALADGIEDPGEGHFEALTERIVAEGRRRGLDVARGAPGESVPAPGARWSGWLSAQRWAWVAGAAAAAAAVGVALDRDPPQDPPALAHATAPETTQAPPPAPGPAAAPALSPLPAPPAAAPSPPPPAAVTAALPESDGDALTDEQVDRLDRAIEAEEARLPAVQRRVPVRPRPVQPPPGPPRTARVDEIPSDLEDVAGGSVYDDLEDLSPEEVERLLVKLEEEPT